MALKDSVLIEMDRAIDMVYNTISVPKLALNLKIQIKVLYMYF